MSKYHQLFVTHCLTSDSVLGEAGFSIRATSLKSDHPLLSVAMNLNAYELPLMAYDGARPYPWEAPIRLAAVPLKESIFVAIMHSVYMETDTRGRPNSYFTHVVFIPKEDFSWRTTLKSWGAIQWQMPDVSENPHEAFNPPRWITQWPNHATNVLPLLESLPTSGLTDHHFIDELYEYYLKTPKALEIVLGGVLGRLKKKSKQISEQKNGDEPIRGYLLPRDKININQSEGHYADAEQSEEDNSFWPKNSQFRFGENIRETLLQLAFIAWFFPENLLTDQGFSTYEPHKYGVSIAKDKLLVGIVHAKDENPNEMMTSQGVEYYSAEKEGSLAVDPSDDFFKWGKQQIDHIFKEKTLIKFSKEIDQVFKSFKKPDWDCYQKSKELFDAIKDYEQKTNFNTAYKLLTFAKTNDYALEKFIEKQGKALPDFIDACFKFHPEKKDEKFKSVLNLLANSRFFDWGKVCTHLTIDNFWQLSKKDNKLAKRFSFFKSILENLKSASYKDQLKNSLNNFFFADTCFQIWRKDDKWIWELFDFYYQINEKDLAKIILSKASCDEVIKSILKQWKKNARNNSDFWLTILPWLMELSVKNGKGNKRFEELYNDATFVLMLVEITNTNTYKDWIRFFYLYEKKGLEVLAKTSIDGQGMPLTSQLMKFLLNAEKLLPEEIVSNILFSGNAPRVFKIIGNGSQLPDWLSEKIDQFLERIDPAILFSTPQSSNSKKDGLDYRAFPFENLLKELEKVPPNSASNYTHTEMVDRLKALVAMKKYADYVPDLFEINKFEQNIKILQNWGGKENTGLRKVVIDYLATKVKKFEDKEGGYDKAQGKFILLITALNSTNNTYEDDNTGIKNDPNDILNIMSNRCLLLEIHIFPPPLLEKNAHTIKNLTLLLYSLINNECIPKFAISNQFGNVNKIKSGIKDKFASNYNWPHWVFYCLVGVNVFDVQRLVSVSGLFLFVFMVPFLSILGFPKFLLFELGKNNNWILYYNLIFFGLLVITFGFLTYYPATKKLNDVKNLPVLLTIVLAGFFFSVFSYWLMTGIGWPFGLILFMEMFWFLAYMLCYKDPIDDYI